MCRLQNIALCDYQESVTTGQTDTQSDRQMPDKIIPVCRYASQATQKGFLIRWLSCKSSLHGASVFHKHICFKGKKAEGGGWATGHQTRGGGRGGWHRCDWWRAVQTSRCQWASTEGKAAVKWLVIKLSWHIKRSLNGDLFTVRCEHIEELKIYSILSHETPFIQLHKAILWQQVT